MVALLLSCVVVFAAVGHGQPLAPAKVVQAEFVPPWVDIAPGGEYQVALRLVIAPGWHINAPRPGSDFLIPTQLRWELPPGIRAEVEWPEPVRQALPLSERPFLLYQGELTVPISLHVDPGADLPERLTAVLLYQACNDEVCLPPAELSLAIPISPAGAGQAPVPTSPEAAGTFGRGLAWSLTVAFLLGLGLNLTPCVYPMVPVTVAYFAREAGRRPVSTLGVAGVYVAGLALAYSALGTVAALGGGMLGGWLGHPAVLAVVAAAVTAFALSFLGLYSLRPPRRLLRRLPRASGLPGAFIMGALLGVVAAPCVGPATVGLLSYVATLANPFQGFLLFLSLALGLGTPYLGLALFSDRLARLPRSGPWTVWVERMLGLVMLGLALYLVAPVIPAWATGGGVVALAGGGGLFLFFLQRGRGGRGLKLARWGALATGLAVALLAAVPSPKQGVEWIRYDQAPFSQLRDEGKTVLVYFAANWCAPCRELAATTFRDEDVIAWLSQRRISPIKVDLTRAGGPAEELREELQVLGVPTLILFQGHEELGRLVGYIAPEAFLAALRGFLEPEASAAPP